MTNDNIIWKTLPKTIRDLMVSALASICPNGNLREINKIIRYGINIQQIAHTSTMSRFRISSSKYDFDLVLLLSKNHLGMVQATSIKFSGKLGEGFKLLNLPINSPELLDNFKTTLLEQSPNLKQLNTFIETTPIRLFQFDLNFA